MSNFKNPNEFRVILAYLSVCIIWGSTYLVMRIGVSSFPPELFAGIRFAVAGTLMLLYAALRGLTFPTSFKDYLNQGLIGAILILGGNGLVIWASQWVHSSITALILATSPLFTAVIEFILPGKSKIGFAGWIGLITGFGGVALLVTSSQTAGDVDLSGGLLLLLAALLWSIGTVYSKSSRQSGSIVTHIGIQMLCGGIGQCILGIFLNEAPKVKITPEGLGAMVYLIFIGSILGYTSFTYLIQKWPAAKAGTYAYVNPVVAVLLGALILDEPITIVKIISCTIILGGVVIVQLSKTLNEKSPAGPDTVPVKPHVDK
ncbi:MAG: EamA family transporter [Clostridia bacterium]|nr:EamA family transporter [Clostridia bacterium]